MRFDVLLFLLLSLIKFPLLKRKGCGFFAFDLDPIFAEHNDPGSDAHQRAQQHTDSQKVVYNCTGRSCEDDIYAWQIYRSWVQQNL